MKKKALWVSLSVIILIIVAIPFGFFYVLNNGNPYTKYIADKNVPAYLEEKGYTENEMEESHYVEPKYLINNDYYHGHYMVVFKDERIVIITEYPKNEKIKQFCKETIVFRYFRDI